MLCSTIESLWPNQLSAIDCRKFAATAKRLQTNTKRSVIGSKMLCTRSSVSGAYLQDGRNESVQLDIRIHSSN